MKNKKKLFLFLSIFTLIVLGLKAWHDEDIFTEVNGELNKGTPNVVFLQDHTGSMSTIIYHPDFNSLDTSLDNYKENGTSDIINIVASGSSGNASDYQGITQTSWYIRWVRKSATPTPIPIYKSDSYASIISYNADTKILRVSGNGNNILEGNWILQYQNGDALNINKQMVAKVTKKEKVSNDYNLTLDSSTIKGTPTLGYYIYTSSKNSSSYTPKIVKLYGTDFDQGGTGWNFVAYAMTKSTSEDAKVRYRYLKWIFGKATDNQRQQVTDFSTLAYDVEYNGGYICMAPVAPVVPPDSAHALNPDNSIKSQTLLEEWNEVMKAIFPSQIAFLANDLDALLTTNKINYSDAQDTFKNYIALNGTLPFYIKIDAETMQVTGHTPSSDPSKAGHGELTVIRAQNSTLAAIHNTGAAIMIYEKGTPGAAGSINEYTPETSLFSSMQHVTESTGEVDKSWTVLISRDWDNNHSTPNTTKNCYRYKRVFTRIQVTREAQCDVITRKDRLFKAAELAGAIDNNQTSFQYSNGTENFKNRSAPFFIKVSDPNDPSAFETMQVTNNDSTTFTLTVTRGTNPISHIISSNILTFSGARDVVRFGIFTFNSDDNPADKLVDLNNFGQKNTDGTYKTVSYINSTILDNVSSVKASGSTPLARALAWVWNYMKPNPGTGPTDYLKTSTSSSANWKAVDETIFGTNEKYELLDDDGDGVNETLHPKGSPVQYYCQENYAILITDGEAQTDAVSDLGVFNTANIKKPTALPTVINYYQFDFNGNYGHNPSYWGDYVNDGTEYLPDVAYFLYHQDMFPTPY